MRALILLVVVCMAAGCSTVSSLEDGEPRLSANTAKLPGAYAKCLAPKWQEINAATTTTETDDGYRLLLSMDYVGAAVLANVDKNGSGSQVHIYKSAAIMGDGRWIDTARSCL